MSVGLDLSAFKTLIREHCGLFFDGAGEEKLAGAIGERMALAGCESPQAYYLRLCASEAEFQSLVNLLTINETYFFREPEQIRLLTERLAPRMLAKGEGVVRILSAGCSSGEEPYSLAMALWEKYGESVSRLFSFTGCDIDSAVLDKARSGLYTEFSFRGMPAEVRSRYFERGGWGWRVKDSVRGLVAFHELNLLASSFPPSLQDFDIIFFRNVSIYFDAATRRRIQANLASLLKNDGLLVIGTAETLANDLGVLPLVEEDGLFYFAKGEVAKPRPPMPAMVEMSPPALAWTLPPMELPGEDSPSPPHVPAPVSLPVVLSPAIEELREWAAEKRFDEVLAGLDNLLDLDPLHPGALLLHAYIMINRKDFAAAGATARRVLEADPWSVDAFMLLGLAAKWSGQAEEAIRWFKQAAYTCHECWPAHFHLGDLYRGRGEEELARRAYRVVLQLLEGTGDTGIHAIPVDLPIGEVRFLCEHRLAGGRGIVGAR